MRILTSVAMLGLTAAAFAQSPLTTTYANNNGNAAGGAVYFDLDVLDPAGLTIFNIDFNCSSAAGTAGTMEVYTTPTTWVGNNSNAAVWSSVASAGVVAAGVGGPTPICIAPGFYLPQGQYGIALVQTGVGQAYTTGTSPFPLNYANADLSLTAGGGTNVPFSATLFSPRVFNGAVHYVSGNNPGVCLPNATKETFGEGCYSTYASFYEQMSTGDFDLTNTDITATNAGGVVTATVASGTGPLPVGGIDPLGGTVLVLPDDGQVAAGTLGMQVGSNGWVALGAGNSNSFSPSVGSMLGNPSAGVYTWTDLQPNNSGTVTYEEDVATGDTRTTFDAVNGWNTTDPVHIQFDYNVNTGDFAIRVGVVGFANPEDWLVGYSPAGASLDPGPTDISGSVASFYEVMDTASFDLTNTDLTGTNNGGAYSVAASVGTGPLPVGGIDPLGGTVLTLVDDGQATAGTLGMSVGSNGWVALGGGNSNGFAPSVSAFLSNPSTGVYCWTDLQPNNSGVVTYEEDIATGDTRTTFDGVNGWNTTDPVHIQFDYNVNTGDFVVRVGVVGFANPEDWLVGYSPGGANVDPGMTDVSAGAATTGAVDAPSGATTDAADAAGLSLDSNTPSLGGNWDLTADDIHASSPGAFFFFGSGAVNPGVDLGGVGAPGCFAYTTADLGAVLELGAGPLTTSLAIPNNAALVGAELTVQATAATPLNAFGVATSNGVTGTLGL